MDQTERELSGADLLSLLCDQTLLCRARADERRTGKWPDDAVRLKAWDHDGYWVGALVPVLIDVILDLCREEPHFVRLHLSCMNEQNGFGNLQYRAEERCPLLASWFAHWACYALIQALCQSPRLADPFVIYRRGRRYRFERIDGVAQFELLRP